MVKLSLFIGGTYILLFFAGHKNIIHLPLPKESVVGKLDM